MPKFQLKELKCAVLFSGHFSGLLVCTKTGYNWSIQC